jgi:hypothetical protein
MLRAERSEKEVAKRTFPSEKNELGRRQRKLYIVTYLGVCVTNNNGFWMR